MPADACRKLIDGDVASLSREQIVELDSVNKARISPKSEFDMRSGTFQDYGKSGKERRYEFDWLDTLRYWYEPWLRVFCGLSGEEFLDYAEKMDSRALGSDRAIYSERARSASVAVP